MVWFRNDLRLHDHQPLLEATQKGSSILPVYCLDPRQFEKTIYQTVKTGFFRSKFLLESLDDLRRSFLEMGANLLVVTGHPEEVLPKLAIEYGIHKVFAYKEVATEEVRLADLVEQKLWKSGISMELYLGNTLYNKEDLPFPIKDIPDVFSNFRKRVEKDAFVRPSLPVPDHFTVLEVANWGDIPTTDILGVPPEATDDRSVLCFKGGEKEGLRLMTEYIWEKELIKTYKLTRNGMLGRDYSSKFSAWLSLGCVSPRKVYETIRGFEKAKGANESSQWLIFELLWRDYFRFVFKKYGSKLFLTKGLKQTSPVENKKAEQLFLDKWKNGETGIPFIDANMRELNATGFMSNRGRQNVASFFVHDLKINWTLGAAYFEEKLIDYNPASNWGNWAYIAGVGNDPRENRYFNILKQAGDYDPKGDYVKTWIPALRDVPACSIHQPHQLTREQQVLHQVFLGGSYPLPVIEFTKAAQHY